MLGTTATAWKGVREAGQDRMEALADADKAIALKNDDVNAYLFRAELFTRQVKTAKRWLI